jgi:hypothetical protein
MNSAFLTISIKPATLSDFIPEFSTLLIDDNNTIEGGELLNTELNLCTDSFGYQGQCKNFNFSVFSIHNFVRNSKTKPGPREDFEASVMRIGTN